jgi:hydroxyacylglutathione hydrolase
MFFRQVLNHDLGCASYVVADSGEAIVVDPRWDIDVYCEMARSEGFRITHVIDTHDHADHLSGRARLAALTGALAHRPARAHSAAAGDLADGETVVAGSVQLTAIATPGHRPEHLALALSDRSRSQDPWLAMTGDSLLVGDLARPDLAVSADLGARELRRSLQRLLALGDHVEVWPAHVGGSLCGGPSLSRKTSSTIGFERRNNQLIAASEDAFVAGLVSNVPPRPPNLSHIVEINRRIVPVDDAEPAVLEGRALAAAIGTGMTIVDGRTASAFDAVHIAGAINLPPAAAAIGTRAGWALGVEEEVVLLADSLDTAHEMALALAAVGLAPFGVAKVDPDSWRAIGLPLRSAAAWDVEELADGLRQGAVKLIDVRDDREWRVGHVADSHHLPLHRLGDGRGLSLPWGPLAVACAAGTRAALAASLLRRSAAQRVLRVSGGGIGDLAGHGFALMTGP